MTTLRRIWPVLALSFAGAMFLLPAVEKRSMLVAQEMTPRYYDIGAPVLFDIWVDPRHGNDSASGSSRTQAVGSLAEAWNRVPSNTTFASTGYRILLVAGEYPDSLMPQGGWMADRWGTYQFPAIIQAADGPLTAHIHAYLDFNDVKYVYLVGLDFVTDPGYGSGGDVVHFAASDHVLVRNCRLNGFDGTTKQPQETIKVNQVQYMYVEDSEFSGAYWFSLDYVGVQYGHIVGSRIHDSGDDCLVLKGGTSYLSIEANEIYNAGVIGFTAGQGTGFEFMVSPWIHYEAYDLKFVNNIVHDTQNAGMAVRGGYNILMAYNTLYRIGIGTTGSPMFFTSPGGRSCDGDTTDCQARHDQGGWGSAADNGEFIPDKDVFVYNNIFYNPAPYQTEWSHFEVRGPITAPSDTNVPSPVLSDDNLRIRGNVIWNGPASMPIGIEDSSQGCQPSNPVCSMQQLMADNSFNSIEPQLVNAASGAYQPVSSGNLFSSVTFQIPDFAGGDRPSPPLSPAGNLSNRVLDDFAGNSRAQTAPPGAYSGSGSAKTPPPTLFIISGQVKNPAGKALPGVSISLTGSGSETAVTDGSGGFSFTDAAAGGTYALTPSLKKYSFTPQQLTFASIAGNQTATFIGKKKRK